MKKPISLCLSLILTGFLLTGCQQAPTSPETDTPPEEPVLLSESPTEEIDEHIPAQEPHMIEGYGQGGYCGNTVTKITANGETYSFWGSDSVELTDLLLYLDYSDGICRCAPEYTVTTEFGDGYGVNLSNAYVRYGDGQAPLTAEQVEAIRAVIDRNCVAEQLD